MKYTVTIKYNDGMKNSWTVSDRETASFILKTEMKCYGKQITSALLKGVNK